MNTSKYDSETRKDIKRFQRSAGYQAMKKEHVAAREAFETKLKDRAAVIEKLTKKLIEAGIPADEVATLAA